VGKRLCGKIGFGSNGFNDYANESLSQWFSACTSHNPTVYAYPYDATYNGQACNGYDLTVYMSVAVGTLSTCQSSVTGYTRVYDLSGNVWEWEDSCNGIGDSARCRLRGGSFLNSSAWLGCGADISNLRSYVYGDIGLRCCAP
jgi:formylglycine-generating enzyme required for sulfatase activity